ERLSRRDGVAALALLPRLLARPGTSSALRAELRRSAAIGAALDHDPDAPAAFRALGPGRLDPLAAEWRVRAALWNGDFAQALAAIDALPTSVAAEPRWQYWRARAVAATAGAAAARPLYAKVAQRRDFYGYLAADRLRRPYRLHVHLAPIDRRVLAQLAADPGLIRARELYRCGMIERATLEWRVALRDADATTFVQAARLAADWGWYERSIIALKQADDWDDLRLRYPRPYGRAVAAASRLARLPPDWLFAVMRQESLYQPDALSPADARGLMQLQPRTAVAIARRWHLRRPTPAQLMRPPVALDLGAAYLRDLLDRFDGQLALGLAAYNAGPAAVERWLPDHPMAADVWIENIPYRETRAYVQHIIEHIVAFAWTRGARPPRLARLLREVQPAPSLAARRRMNPHSFHRGKTG
ncbi:MAG: lytic transglycosylase domain-containing protein, partial [Gammaproteobacteria bacterium]|nr:lytic transglycosylase domain-containing protein [Gammaproteobacteria bacterium]